MSLSLYVHFPFCTNKCHYCDFYKELHNKPLEDKFYDALETELELAIDKLPERTLSTIFIGGGTPSLTNLDRFDRFVQKIQEYFTLAPNLEFSIECNPETVDRDVLTQLKNIGVNRPTYGLQTFNKKLLKVLGRRHNPYHSQRAVYFSNALGFKTFGVDLIFGIPKQTSRTFSTDLEQLIDLDPPHISFYQLTVEEGTKLYNQYKAGEITLLEEELVLAMYKSGCEKLKDAGYTRYEICSFAKPGHECRHNIGYWDGTDYLGLGPSAHSFINGQRFLNKPNLAEYLNTLKNRELPREVDESGIEERMTEAILLGLRTQWGVSRKRFSKRFDKKLEDKINMTQYEQLLKSGYIVDEDDTVKLTDEGIYLVEDVTRRLLE